MAEQTLQPTYQLSETEKSELVESVKQAILSQEGGIPLSDADKADIIQEALGELYAKSQDVKALEEATSLEGIASLPAIRGADGEIVSVPLGLLAPRHPIEVSGQGEIDILVAQGKIAATQLYFTPVDDE